MWRRGEGTAYNAAQGASRLRRREKDLAFGNQKRSLVARSPTLAACAVVGALLPALGGCQGVIVGSWHMVECTPNKDVFCVDDADFRRDGTFAAMMTIEGRTAREVGTYRFNGFKLRLRPQAGGERTFNATRRPTSLEVTRGSSKVVLRKGRKRAKEDEQ